MVGQKCGRFIVLESAGKTKHGALLWKCQCKCGTTKNVRGIDLRSGGIRSCGCIHPRLDLTGQQYGKLTVLEVYHKKGTRGQVLWKCQCECGNIAIVPTTNLRSGNSKSCGCVRRYTGENSLRWDANILTEDRKRHRNEGKAMAWREAIYLRDNYTCAKCGQRCDDPHAHHIIPYAKNKELRYELINGITICAKCHGEFHALHWIDYSKSAFENWLAGTVA